MQALKAVYVYVHDYVHVNVDVYEINLAPGDCLRDRLRARSRGRRRNRLFKFIF
jgi:hypothetical protein